MAERTSSLNLKYSSLFPTLECSVGWSLPDKTLWTSQNLLHSCSPVAKEYVYSRAEQKSNHYSVSCNNWMYVWASGFLSTQILHLHPKFTENTQDQNHTTWHKHMSNSCVLLLSISHMSHFSSSSCHLMLPTSSLFPVLLYFLMAHILCLLAFVVPTSHCHLSFLDWLFFFFKGRDFFQRSNMLVTHVPWNKQGLQAKRGPSLSISTVWKCE